MGPLTFVFQIQNALLAFQEVAESLPDDIKEKAKLSRECEPTDDTGKTLLLKDFITVSTNDEVPFFFKVDCSNFSCVL